MIKEKIEWLKTCWESQQAADWSRTISSLSFSITPVSLVSRNKAVLQDTLSVALAGWKAVLAGDYGLLIVFLTDAGFKNGEVERSKAHGVQAMYWAFVMMLMAGYWCSRVYDIHLPMSWTNRLLTNKIKSHMTIMNICIVFYLRWMHNKQR